MIVEPKIDYTYCPPKPGNYTVAYRTPENGKIKGLVFHWTGNLSKTADARANADYYCNGSTSGVGAHFFLDNISIYASTPESCQAGAIGKWAASVYLSDLRNGNTLSVEMIPRSMSGKTTSNAREDDMYFDQGTINNAIALGRYLIKKYNIKKENVIRHYDVYGSPSEAAHVGDPNYVLTDQDKEYKKWCPLPLTGSFLNKYWNRTGDEAWQIFRDYLFSDNPAPLDLVKHDSPINPTYKQWTAEVTHITQDDYLNVRTGAGASYPNLPSYPRLALGNRVDVVSEALADDGRIWFQIRIAGKYYGYVRSDYLQPLTEIKIAKVDHVQRLIVRSAPVVKQSSVYKLYNYLGLGNYVEVLDSSDRFFDRIRFQDQKGGYHIAYASRYYLERV